VSHIGLASLFPDHPNAVPAYIARGFRLVRTGTKALTCRPCPAGECAARAAAQIPCDGSWTSS
jgi:hypothetical protein